MIELSFSKLLLLAVIALVVLGPEKLPKVARMAGAMLRRLRVGWDSVRSEVERELQLEEIRRAAKEAADRADSARKEASADLHSLHSVVSEPLRDVTATVTDTAHAVGAMSKDADDGRA